MSDFANRIEEAKGRLPLRRLMEQYGKGPENGNWRSFPHCPYCHKKGGVGTFGEGTEERFKCHHTSCSSGTAGDNGSWDQIGFLAHEHALNRKDAAIAFLKMAGPDLWREKERLAPSVMPGKAGRKNRLPSISKEDLASAGLSSSNGTTWCNPDCGGTGPGQVGSPADATLSPETAVAHHTGDSPAGKEEPSAGNSDSEPAVTVSGVTVGAGSAVENTTHPSGNCAPQSPPVTHAALPGAGAVSEEGKDSKIPGVDAPSTPALPGQGTIEPKIVDMSGKPVAAESAKSDENKIPAGYIMELAPGLRVMMEFFSRLTLSEIDEKLLFEKRGLESRTSQALQFRSNPKSNKEVLQALSSEHSWDDLFAAGLWLREDRKSKRERRPNAKFYGFGIAGKKPNGEWDYKWNNPIIIPYFDETGKLLSLRPHKDMGPGSTLTGTPHVYVPRDPTTLKAKEEEKTKPELFETVVVTEGEFKAAALWQIVGAGRQDGKTPMGVAALPGISFGKNYEVREELDGWLRRVKCRCVKVIYDNEEKGDPKFPEAYKTERRKRFDSQIWARYLATDIAQKLHIRGEVGMLPNEWRNSKGKADWDGAMAEFARRAA